MKRRVRIISLISALVLLIAIFAIVAAADSTSEVADDPSVPNFKVGDTLTDSWSDAVGLAKGEEIIYLNDNVSISATLSIGSNARLDLNGKTIIDTRANTGSPNNSAVFQFASKTGISFELLGEGTIKNCAMVITGGASESVKINAYGDGIRIERVATGSSSNPARIFNVTQGSEWFVSGKIEIVPSGVVQNVFYLGAGTSALVTDVHLTGAEITVNVPTTDTWVHSTSSGQWFAYMHQYTKLTVENSDIDIRHGNGIKFNYTSTTYTVENDANYDVTTTEIAESAVVAKDSWVTITDSSLYARTGGYSKAYNYSGVGTLFATGTAAAEVRCTDSTLIGASRTIAASDNKKTNVLNPSNFYFKDVKFYMDEQVRYGSAWAVSYNMNMDWNGGSIFMRYNSMTPLGTITLDQWKAAYLEVKGSACTLANLSSIDTEEELFGDVAKAAAKKAGFEITEEMKGDGYVAGYENNAIIYAKAQIKNGSACHNRSHEYTTIKIVDSEGTDTGKSLWFGVRFANIGFFGTSGLPTQTNGKDGGDSTVVGTYCAEPVFIVDGEVVKYACGYYESYAAPINPENGTVGRFTTSFDTVQSYSNTAAKVTTGGYFPINSGVYAGGHGDRHGSVSITNALWGDEGYVRFSIASDETPVGTAGSYFELKSTGYGSEKKLTASDAGYSDTVNGYSATSATYPLKDYKYFIQEFDIFTDTGKYFKTSASYLNRFRNPSYASSAFGYQLTQLNSGAGYFLQITNDGKFSLYGNNAKGTYQLPTDGTATRITFVLDINYEAVTYDLQTGADTYASGRTGYKAGKTVMHVFANGTYLGYRSIVNSNTIMDAAVFQSWGLDALRLESTYADFETNKGASMCFDNLTQSYYKASSAEAGIIASALANESIEGSELFNYWDNFKYEVDGVGYTNEDDALEAIKAGSTLELFKDFEKPISVNGTLKIITNGYKTPELYSENYRAIINDGNYYLVPAMECDKINVSFSYPELEIETEKKFALGTNIYSPVDLLTCDKVTVGGKETYLMGWSLKAGEEYTTVEEGLTTAYPVHGIANVSWTDALGNVVMTEAYRPTAGSYPALPENLAVDTEVETGNGWYDLKVTGWDKALATELREDGDYVLSPDTTPVEFYTAKTVSDIKIGLTLYGYYEMNIYIPVYSQDEHVSGVMLKNADGTAVGIRYISKDTTVPTTINGKEYVKYYVNVGVADTDAREFVLTYCVDGIEFSQTITYGVPAYASQVMNDPKQPENAKTLVMNMVNYAVAVVDLMGSDADLSIYEGLLERYSDGYFDIYDKLVDERFATEDDSSTDGVTNDIYNSLIKDLTYDDKDNENAAFIGGASFWFSTYEPTFAIKYSDTAKAYSYTDGDSTTVLGVKKPTSANGIKFDDVGVWFYVTYGTGKSSYCHQYAYDKDGNVAKYNDENAWNPGGTSKDYDYYALTYNVNSANYNSRDYRSLETVTETIKIVVYRCAKLNKEGKALDGNGGILQSGTVTYSLAAYYKGMLDLRAELQTKIAAETDATVIAELQTELTECVKTIEATRALYAYSLVAKAY